MMTNYFTFGSKKIGYSFTKPFKENGVRVVEFFCIALKIKQTFLLEDIPELILDLPNIALNQKEYEKNKTEIKFRVHKDEKQIIEKKALERGFSNTSSFLRELVMNA